MNLKEMAKFLSGVAAWEAIVHLALAFSGLLPISWFGIITLTQTTNAIPIVVSASVSILLAYYAWGKKA
jgi:hypothetical protein